MKKIVIFGKRIPNEVQTFIERTIDSLVQEGCSIFIYERFQTQINEHWGLNWNFPEFKSREDILKSQPDFLLVIGGDGTLLDATTLVEGTDIPIIGLNTGNHFLLET